jgi:hypothetical protein
LDLSHEGEEALVAHFHGFAMAGLQAVKARAAK